MTTIFLSYSRNDDEPFVKQLHDDLSQRGFDVWWDRISMPNRALTFLHEIREAITQRDRLIFVVGPKAVSSDYVEAEWRYALEVGKAISPVLRLGDYDLLPEELKLLDAPDFRDDARYAEQLEKLMRQVSEPVAPMGKLVGVPSLPPHLLKRPDRLRALKDSVLSDLRRPVVVTGTAGRVGIYGMGGIGKSVLATMLARDHEVRRAFPDGIMWIPFGQQPPLIERQREVAKALDDPGHFDTAQEGKAKLGELLAHRAVLLILDDVWEAPHVGAFDVQGPRCRLIITTRDASLITALGGTQHQVQLLAEAEALALMAQWAECSVDALPPTAREVMTECGRLPLALSICGAMVRDGTPWTDVLAALREADLEFLNHPHGNVLKSIKISVDALTPDQQRRFAELAVFAPDQTVPEAAVLTLWTHTGYMQERNARQLLTVLERRSLLRLDTEAPDAGQAPKRRVSLHDLLRDYAIQLAGDTKELHGQLIEAYRKHCPHGWPTSPNDGYFLQNLCHHLAEAGMNDELVSLLLNLSWIEVKAAHGLVFDLQRDYARTAPLSRIGADERRQLAEFEDFVRRESHILAAYPALTFQQAANQPDALAPTVLARSLWDVGSETRPWLQWVNKPQGRDPCLMTLAGHTRGVNACAYSPDGRRIVSGSGDGTLKVWEAETGSELATLAGHTIGVSACAYSPDGRHIVSGSGDGTLKVWEAETGRELSMLQGHARDVFACAYSPDGRRIVSGSGDHTLKVWDVETGSVLATLAGHASWVSSCAYSPDGRRIVSGSGDYTLKVWEAETGRELSMLQGHAYEVFACAYSPDGRRIVSGSRDGTLKIWDVETGSELATLAGHTIGVSACAYSPDGRRIVSGSGDRTLKVWDAETGSELATLAGHTSIVYACAYSPDGRRIVSGSVDHTLKVWEAETGSKLATLAGHASWVSSCAYSPDGRRIVSGAMVKFNVLEVGKVVTREPSTILSTLEGKLEVWDAETGRELSSLAGHTRGVNACAYSPDGRRIVSGSEDKTLKVWDAETGRELSSLAGHTRGVNACAYSPDGRRIVSGSGDGTLKIWDVETGSELATLAGHASWVSSCAYSPDGRRIASGASDRTLKIWDVETGSELATLAGHASWVSSCAYSPDGRRIVSGSEDKTLKVWDAETGEAVVTFFAEGFYGRAAQGRAGRSIAAGTQLGRIYLLRLVGFEIAAPIVTPVYLYRFDIRQWDSQSTANCEWCGQRFVPIPVVLNAVSGIARTAHLSPDQSPSLALPAEAWDELRLLCECPHCHEPLKFNPFIVDNRD